MAWHHPVNHKDEASETPRYDGTATLDEYNVRWKYASRRANSQTKVSVGSRSQHDAGAVNLVFCSLIVDIVLGWRRLVSWVYWMFARGLSLVV